MPPPNFGECAILNDGTLVIAPFGQPGIWIGAHFVDGEQVRMPDAAQTPAGAIWVSMTHQTGNHVTVLLYRNGIAFGWPLPVGAFGTRTIIRAEGESCRVACTTGASTWRCFQLEPDGTTTPIEQGIIADGSGARGMRDFDGAGHPRPLTPLNGVLDGHPVRSIVRGPLAQIACALPPLPPQTVVEIGGHLGTLVRAEIDQLSPRISANGKWWCGVWYPTASIRSGPIPTVAPPLWTGDPPVPPPLPAKATIVSFDTPIAPTEPSRAVRKITQGAPFQLRWQWRDGTIWQTAAVNNPVDDDHSFNRANPPWVNQFPGPGRYPIRIQCLDKDGHVTDESSGTSRVIEVQADPPPEPPTPIPPPTPLPPSSGRTGIPRGNGFQVIDDMGGFLAWGTSWFWGAGAWLRERARAQQNLDWIAGERIDFPRVIATGLKLGTHECSVSPTDPQFQSTIAGLTDACRAAGRRIQWTIFGATYDAPTVADRARAVDLLCQALQGRESSVQMIEIANEGWQNGFPGDAGAKELKDLVARVRTHLPNTLVAPTCPQPGDDVTPEKIKYYYQNTQASIQTHHYARATTSPDGVWRPTRKPWRESKFAVDGCCLLVQNGEPRGPDSSGTQTHDPLVLAMDACTTWLCGVGAYVLHSGAGVFGVFDPGHPDRPSNLWETTGISAITSGIRTVRSLLPADLPNWQKHQAKAADAPFSFVDTPQEQFTAAYSATSGNQIILPVSGVVQATSFTLKSGTCSGRVYDPLSGQVIEVFDKTFHTTPDRPAVLAIATRT